jgi:hypothetical protein
MVMGQRESAYRRDLSNALANPSSNGPITVLWWTRGGEPGPGYTSDKLELRIAQAGPAEGSYVRARFNKSYDPPFLSEEYSIYVPRELWLKLVQAIGEEDLFDTKLPSEGRSDIADAIKETIRIEIGKRSYEKTLYLSEPNELIRSKEALNQIVRFLVERGSHKIRNRQSK